ncbi:MAG TPA: protein kinase [Gemmatimonadota bacterium]|nr:protein kinase [Gemmatimonadota bacterium]
MSRCKPVATEGRVGSIYICGGVDSGSRCMILGPLDLSRALAGRYAIEREVGRGGMATVYVADDLKHHRKVAVKVLKPELSATLAAERFLREIEIVAALSHPNILPLHDSGAAAGFLYFVMPYIDGESLRDRLEREGQLTTDEAVRITCEVADALAAAHRQGVVHRDVKPANILLEADHALVADFGIARAVSAAGVEELTETGIAVGTPSYMSPEQAYGEDDIDHRSDLYSLACVLYEMLVGQPPFTGPNSRAIIARHLVDIVPPIRTVRPEVPMGVARAVRRALSKAAADRYPTLTDFARALKANNGEAEESAGKSIAVLPFANMSATPEDEYFSDGITEEIINSLTKIDGLHVVSRTSAFAFKGKNEDVRAIGEQLNVSSVLEGSVRRSGKRLRVTAQLVNASDGYHLWSERYDRELEDVFVVQDEIAEAITQRLQVTLSDEDKRVLAKLPTTNVNAYEYYLRGRQYFHQSRKKSLEYARQMFEKAIETDPNYALAYAGAADCSSLLHMYYPTQPGNLERADHASRKALHLDPESPEAHAARGFALWQLGNDEEARSRFETAMRLDPMQFEARYFFARASFQQGDLEKAARLFEEAASVRDDYQASFFAAQSYAALGRDADAEAAYRRALQVAQDHLELNPDDPRAVTMCAVARCRLGDRTGGLECAEAALAIDPDDAGIRYNVACLYALEGETDRAVAALEAAIRAGFGRRDWIEHDPDLDSLRDDPRFLELLSTL